MHLEPSRRRAARTIVPYFMPAADALRVRPSPPLAPTPKRRMNRRLNEPRETRNPPPVCKSAVLRVAAARRGSPLSLSLSLSLLLLLRAREEDGKPEELPRGNNSN